MCEKPIIIDGIKTNYVVRDDGTVWNTKKGREMIGTYERNEYRSVQILVEGKRKSIMVHRLVAEAFCDNPNNYTIVHHIDGNKDNNRAENLEWVTTQKNNEKTCRDMKHCAKPTYCEVQLDENWKCLEWIDRNYYINRDGVLWNSKNKLLLVGSYRNGYHRYSIGRKICSAHILVWQAFKGEIPEGYYIDHIDNDRSNNCLDNLRMVTQSENMYHTMENGHACQVPILMLDENKNVIKEYSSIAKVLEEIDISRPTLLSIIVNGRKYNGNYYVRKENDALKTP